MRKFIYTLFVVLVSVVGCHRPAADAPPLAFYIVSEQKIDGGRFIDTPELPKLGYIAAKPDMVVDELEYANCDPKAIMDSVMVDDNNKETVVPVKSHAAVEIKFNSADRKRFTSLTERAIGKRILLMQGDVPLMAPDIRMPIDAPGIMISLGSGGNPTNVVEGLKKLVR